MRRLTDNLQVDILELNSKQIPWITFWFAVISKTKIISIKIIFSISFSFINNYSSCPFSKL